jgi:hypothetical protein
VVLEILVMMWSGMRAENMTSAWLSLVPPLLSQLTSRPSSAATRSRPLLRQRECP